jgi:hypothetical protein
MGSDACLPYPAPRSSGYRIVPGKVSEKEIKKWSKDMLQLNPGER